MILTTPGRVASPLAHFAADVRKGLSRPRQKELPSKYLYDEIGSALFEVISLLPEYGLTRADERLLKRSAPRLAAIMPSPVIVAELGSGNGKKARWILEALARRHPTTYCPIEISHAALMMAEHETGDLDRVNVLGFETEYLDGLRRVATRRKKGQQLLVLFLGSSIGNFDPAPASTFLAAIRSILSPGDAMLLSADLVKPLELMIAAYNDALGVTAAFNLNLLARINRRLGGEFDLSLFRHQAVYNARRHRIEMHLRSAARQQVAIRQAGLTARLEPGETIWTESSYKYSLDSISEMARKGSFRIMEQWVDDEWPFALTLLAPAGLKRSRAAKKGILSC